MKLSCPSCGAKYSIADEKVSDRLAKIRCRKCSATIIVDGKVNPPSVYTSSEAAPAPAQEEADAGGGGGGVGAGEYSVDFGDNDQRTLTIDDIIASFRRGELNQDTYVWAEGFADWQPISSVPELADALRGASPAAASPGAAARAAARTGAGRGSATDLFGGIDTAGSEEDVMTSAPQGAPPPAPSLAATGARNESSVLFSLSALTASAPVAPSAARSSAAAVSLSNKEGDDSGLIDLKALTSAAAASAPASPLMLGTAPLGMAAPLGGMTAPAIPSDRPQAKQGGSKTGLYIAAAIVVVGALIAGAIVFTGGKGAETPVAAGPVPTGEPTAVAEKPAEEAKREAPTAAPPSTGTAETPKAEASAAPSATAAAAKPTSVTPAKVASGGSHAKPKAAAAPVAEKPAEKPAAKPEPAEPAAEKKPPKKKEKTCSCAAGDLMCAMKCAAS